MMMIIIIIMMESWLRRPPPPLSLLFEAPTSLSVLLMTERLVGAS
jgi:hypothetical protein